MKEKKEMFDMKLLGDSVASAEAMCKKDKVLEKKARKNMAWMKKNRISVAEMAGFAH
jgi:hypothetical protein